MNGLWVGYYSAGEASEALGSVRPVGDAGP